MDGVVSVPGLLLGDFQTEESYWAHEMGHAFGLQHSLSKDDPYNIYDTAYDIMSSPGGECFTGNVIVDTPDEFKAYDPALYELIGRVFDTHRIPMDVFHGKRVRPVSCP